VDADQLSKNNQNNATPALQKPEPKSDVVDLASDDDRPTKHGCFPVFLVENVAQHVQRADKPIAAAVEERVTLPPGLAHMPYIGETSPGHDKELIARELNALNPRLEAREKSPDKNVGCAKRKIRTDVTDTQSSPVKKVKIGDGESYSVFPVEPPVIFGSMTSIANIEFYRDMMQPKLVQNNAARTSRSRKFAKRDYFKVDAQPSKEKVKGKVETAVKVEHKDEPEPTVCVDSKTLAEKVRGAGHTPDSQKARAPVHTETNDDKRSQEDARSKEEYVIMCSEANNKEKRTKPSLCTSQSYSDTKTGSGERRGGYRRSPEGVQRYACQYCHLTFRFQTRLGRHVQNDHLNDVSATISPSVSATTSLPVSALRCPGCSFVGQSQLELKIHLNTCKQAINVNAQLATRMNNDDVKNVMAHLRMNLTSFGSADLESSSSKESSSALNKTDVIEEPKYITPTQQRRKPSISPPHNYSASISYGTAAFPVFSTPALPATGPKLHPAFPAPPMTSVLPGAPHPFHYPSFYNAMAGTQTQAFVKNQHMNTITVGYQNMTPSNGIQTSAKPQKKAFVKSLVTVADDVNYARRVFLDPKADDGRFWDMMPQMTSSLVDLPGRDDVALDLSSKRISPKNEPLCSVVAHPDVIDLSTKRTWN